VGLAFLLIDVISIENFLSFQIEISSGSDKYWMLFRLCKQYLKANLLLPISD
jgi:hypothetical protein